MDDAPTGQLVPQDSPVPPAASESADTDAGGAGTAPEDAWRASGRQRGGRRYSAGRPPPRRRSATEQSQVQPTPLPAGFRTWAVLGGLFACCLVSCLLAAWTHLIVPAGLGFCLGCVLAAWYCQPPALLRMVVAVPSVFLVAEIVTQVATLHGGGRRGLALPVAAGTLLTLAAVAPWLFAGTAGAVAIALFRGLPRCVRDLRADLLGRAPVRRARGPHGRRGPPAEQALRAQAALRAMNAQRAQRAHRAPRG